ncbi:TetR/AcrR family transcriptional regulator [Aldersonia sp. NBC_00410]|uniref:TetR/AcrR family transcriptional regulator n=1 Tax=Aldersonia sp. NBC_00410 TaxID=2975954 RepID=UPI00224E8CAC|nr:TetR/AcrR family transcriptional regulator [Aldersonia sp. NBC_00410]MCX5043870.1 TetR/AcrR family transcriptional regulator [Aldersonia sp. NBC_00410]
MSEVAGPRERLIDGTIALVREQGVHGAGLAELLDRTNTSRNSLYQHFPSGKSELVVAATEVAGERMAGIIDKIVGTGGPADWIRSMIGYWRRTLQSRSYATGCPLMGAALAESDPPVQAAAAGAFTAWIDRLAEALAEDGLPAERARSTASFVISSVEGAIVVARARKSTQPLDDAEANLLALLSADPRASH